MNSLNEILKDSLILIVDDTMANIQVLGSILRRNGCQIAVANNGKDALVAAQKDKPDLILMDVMMPIMDGFTAAKILKNSQETKHIPIIFLTAKVGADDVVEGFESGGEDYLTKPFNTKELLSRVKNQIELKKAREKIDKQNTERKELLHILCHDLENSYGGVMGIANISDTQEDFFELRPRIIETMQNSLDIINLVRKLRALEDKKQVITLSCVNLLSAITYSSSLLIKQIEDKGVSIEVDVSPKINVVAEETSLINSVLNNLLTNATKFSYAGGLITIKAQLVGDKIVIKIADLGIGMPKMMTEELFDVSKNTHRQGTEGEIGTGYGMALVKKFIKIYGGEISVTSQGEKEFPEDHWTCFEIQLASC
ncbi:MAG: hybrid sensor histidine kinase/response regulator [SAR324 cluster bacterium]|nr:hybrid sensor histidine kinase/response regulator [SAR324 cluster bacterium]